MDKTRKSCCARATGWAAVGIVIAVAWGIGNLTSGIGVVEAIAVPVAIVAIAVGFIALPLVNAGWFNRLCACPGTHDRDGKI
jgi:hypothetical protein